MKTESGIAPLIQASILDTPDVKEGTGMTNLRDQLGEVRAQDGSSPQRVGRSQKRTTERKQLLVKQPALIVSIIALLISTGFSGYTAYQQLISRRGEEREKKEEEIKKKIETLRQTIIQLTEMRMELFRAGSVADKDLQAYYQSTSIANAKRQTLIETANALIQDYGDRVSASIFATLAYELLVDSKFDEAKTLYLRSLERGDDPIVKNAALRGLAMLYMTPGTSLHDIEKARARWQEAVDLVKGQSDEYSRQVTGQTTSMWAAAEFYNGDKAKGISLLEQASDEFSRMNEKNPVRKQMLDQVKSLGDANKSGYSTVTSIDKILASVGGNWDIQYKEEPNRIGKAMFIVNQQAKTLTMNEDVFENSKLIQKSQGNAIILDPDTIRIEWVGSKYLVFNAPGSYIYITGTTVLKLTSAHRCSGKEYVLGDSTYTLSMKK